MAKKDRTNSVNKAKKNRSIIHSFAISIISLIVIITCGAILGLSLDRYEEEPAIYFSKNIKDEITKAIINDADLELIKHIYQTRELKHKNFMNLFTKEENIYQETTTLDIILKDIKKDYYTSNSKLDSIEIYKLNQIINENEIVNPFDKLQPNQKLLFENLKKNSDTIYPQITDDVNRIAEELKNKNLLVNEYLSNSKLSFWISIFALVITCLSSIYQIYYNIKNDNRKGTPLKNDKKPTAKIKI